MVSIRICALVVIIYLSCVSTHPITHRDGVQIRTSLDDLLKSVAQIRPIGKRHKRSFDLILGAEHEQNVGTDVSVEALLNVWKSPDENTRVDAALTYNQRFGSSSFPDNSANGNARFGGKLTFHHE